MATTFISADNTGGGFTIVTRVIPVRPASAGTGLFGPVTGPDVYSAALDRTLEHSGSSGELRVEKFLKRQPKALGTMQITAAVVTFLLGIVLTVDADTLSVRSLFVYWGSLIYISAGCLSIAATNKPHPCVMKGLLAMNVVSAITAGIAVVLLSLDLASGPGNYCASKMCNAFKKQTNGINGVLLVFSLLQFITSICMSLFGCDFICCTDPLVPVSSRLPTDGASCSLLNPFPAHSNQEGVFVISNTNMNNSIPAHPPEYSETEPLFQPLVQHTTSGPAATRIEWNIPGI